MCRIWFNKSHTWWWSQAIRRFQLLSLYFMIQFRPKRMVWFCILCSYWLCLIPESKIIDNLFSEFILQLMLFIFSDVITENDTHVTQTEEKYTSITVKWHKKMMWYAIILIMMLVLRWSDMREHDQFSWCWRMNDIAGSYHQSPLGAIQRVYLSNWYLPCLTKHYKYLLASPPLTEISYLREKWLPW